MMTMLIITMRLALRAKCTLCGTIDRSIRDQSIR